jgi:hypothetical protein
MDKNKFWLGGRLFITASPMLAAATQRKARPQYGRPNATQGLSASWAPTQRKARPQHKACPQVGHRNATQGTSARWSPKCKIHPQRKRPHKGALGLKTSWRMDKKFFWLGGRVFNTAPPRLGAPMQRKARPRDGHPNATQDTSQCTSASLPPQCTSATQTQGTSVRPQVGCPNAMKGTSARWVPKRNARHVRKMGTQTKNRSATKTSTQGSTRLKDKLEEG